jgi:L-asparaginase
VKQAKPAGSFASALAIFLLLTLSAPAGSAGQQPAPASSPPQPAQGVARPYVRLVATGGTIANRPGSRLTAEELVQSVPDLDRHVRVDVEQFSNVPSSQLSLDQWLALARRLNAILSGAPTPGGVVKGSPEGPPDGPPDGVVVTTGTDTLEELAYFLHLTVRSDRPVVLVGSMRRPGAVGYEGAANLLSGFRVAGDARSRGRGVLVVLNDEILSAREASKADAQRLNAFQSRGYGSLGVVDADAVVYQRQVVRRHTLSSEFDLAEVESLPRVDVLMTYQGAPADLIRAAVDAGARGIVVATAAGATSGTQIEGIRYAIDRKVAVVFSTRTGGGRIAPRPASPPSNTNGPDTRVVARGIAAQDLAPLKARVLLMLALTRTTDPVEIQRMFSEY